MVLTAAVEPLIPALLKPLLDESMANAGGSAVSTWMPLSLMGAFVLKGVLEYFSSVVSQRITQEVIHDIRVDVFSSVVGMSLSQFSKSASGHYLSKVTFDVGNISSAVSTAWLTLVKDVLIVVFLLGYLLYMSWALTLVILLFAPLVSFLIISTSRKISRSSKRLQDHSSALNGQLVDYFSVQGIRDTRIFRATRFAVDSFRDSSQDFARETILQTRIQALGVPLVQIIAATGVCLCILIALLTPVGLDSPGSFVSFMAAMAMVFEPVRRLANLNVTIQRGLVAIRSVQETLRSESIGGRGRESGRPGLVASEDSAGFLNSRSGLGLVARGLEKRLADGRVLLGGINLNIPSGACIGIVGESGAGKSTLAAILAGLEPADSGDVLCAEPSGELHSISEELLGPGGIIYLGPQSMLFGETVLINVSFGRDGSEGFSLTRDALRAAGMDSFAENLYEILGLGGREISSGERQRISLARVFFARPRLLILDEATASIDEETERSVINNIRTMLPELTTVVIAHRASALEKCSSVFRLHDGKLIAASDALL